ncbi:alpha/beta hydrolase fold domain-containing protein [Nocardioides sp. CER19]|uniref:alpha/beta hydrolase fold domain-containing protein n=1 Tax=Nocardioides sp. CER19 TaxID=3038538 RepID=UPI0024493C44|nr:alpha/beta hydrolase fold domain-containing protein [Nocardioides sp. CER19]MDH2416157.1 alpha/beta hydrolase fold domain-containing protein [Nocardioides sp. CER19]
MTTAALRLVPPGYITNAFTKPARRKPGPLVPKRVASRFVVDEFVAGHGRVATVSPRRSVGHFFFLHGGGYTMQDMHWGFLGQLLEQHFTVSLVDYPLAPEYTVTQTVPMVVDAWSEVLRRSAGEAMTVLGDSAGAGLALVLAQELLSSGVPAPTRTVLLSPWLNLVLDDKATLDLAERDPLLNLDALHGAARLYAGGRVLSEPALSPINGPLDDLGDLLVFSGTRDLLFPQASELSRRAAGASGTSVDLRVIPGLLHDWALIPYLPETRRLATDVCVWALGGALAR